MTWKKFNFDESLLTMGEFIGRGSFGRVSRATLGNRKVAVKELYFNSTDSFDDECPEISFPEFYLQRRLTEKAINSDETGILEIYGFYMLKLSRYAIFPYCEFSLEQAMPVIQKLRTHPEENAKALYQKIVLGFFLSMLNALRTLSNNNIVHRDIKPANILFSPDESQDALLRWCLSDFGCAFDLTSAKATGTYGTLHYVAPEALKKIKRYDLYSNIWGIAHILFEMFNTKNVTRIGTYLLDGEIVHYSNQEQSQNIRTLLGLTLTEAINIEEETFRNNINDAETFSACLNSTVKKMHQETPELRTSLLELEFAAKKLRTLSPRLEESDRSRFFSLVHENLTKQKQPIQDSFTLVSGSASQRHSVVSQKLDALTSPQQLQLAIEESLDDSQFEEGIFLERLMGVDFLNKDGVKGSSDDSETPSFYQSRERLSGVPSLLSAQSKVNTVIQNGFGELEKTQQMCSATMIAETVLIPKQSTRHLDETTTETGVKLISQWQLFLMNFQGDASSILGINPAPNAKIPVSQLIPVELRAQHQKWVHTLFSGKKSIQGNWYSFFNGMLKRPVLFLVSPAGKEAPCESDRKQPVSLEMQLLTKPDNNSALSRHWSFFVVFKKLNTLPQDAIPVTNVKKNVPTFSSALGAE